MRRRQHVALLVETSNSYARGLLEGVISYVREHESWSIYLPEQRRGEQPPAWLDRWRGDGIIARIENAEIAAAVERMGLPVVDVSAARTLPAVPWVETDDVAIAQAAFDHLAERGFRRLAFCGEPRFNWSNWRAEHFERIAKQAGCEVWSYPSRGRAGRTVSWNQEHTDLSAWVRRLPRPVGIMACYDIKGQQLLDVCRNLDIAVPEQVAVIGVDNDHLICELCMPPLSSVIPNTHRTGYLAAELLDQLMSGKPVAQITHLIPPWGILTRRSTETWAIEDRDVAAALRFIREYACDGIHVGQVLREVPLSRRVLESRFVRLLGRTPHEEITRVKIERVKQLLRETDLPLKAIAQRTGFSSEDYLSVAFKRVDGRAPSEFRARCHQARPPVEPTSTSREEGSPPP
jgi:LacI family transcriptional regulator